MTPTPSDQPLYAEQIRLLFRFSLVGYLATLLVVLILGALLWDQLATPSLFAWFFAISMVTVGRYLVYKSFEQGGFDAASAEAWEKRFLAGTVLSSVCWAALGTVLLPAAPLAQRISVVMLVTLLIFRPMIVRKLHLNTTKTVDTFAGQQAIALEDMAVQARGTAELSGSTWSAHNVGNTPLRKGERCTVDRVDGLLLLIRSAASQEISHG